MPCYLSILRTCLSPHLATDPHQHTINLAKASSHSLNANANATLLPPAYIVRWQVMYLHVCNPLVSSPWSFLGRIIPYSCHCPKSCLGGGGGGGTPGQNRRYPPGQDRGYPPTQQNRGYPHPQTQENSLNGGRHASSGRTGGLSCLTCEFLGICSLHPRR